MTYQACPALDSENLCLLASRAIGLIGRVFFHSCVSKTLRVMCCLALFILAWKSGSSEQVSFHGLVMHQAFHNTLCCEEMDCVWVRHASPQRTRNNERFVSATQECCEFFKTLVNNLAAPRLVKYQPQSLCSVTTCSLSRPVRDTLDKCDAVCRIIGGRSPSHDDL